MMVVKVRCSNGHSFGVNPGKHLYVRYRICPHAGCYERVNIRPSMWSFNPSSTWAEQREQLKIQRANARTLKQARKGPRPMFPQVFPAAARQVTGGLLALSSLIHRRETQLKMEEEKAKKLRESGGKPQ